MFEKKMNDFEFFVLIQFLIECSNYHSTITNCFIIIINNFWTDGFWQPVQSQILDEQSVQGLHCLLFHLHYLEVSHHGRNS